MELVEHLGGVADPAAPASASQLAALLRREIARGLEQLPGPRAGYDRPVVLATGALPGWLLAFVPVAARLRTDVDALAEQPRAALIVVSAIEALVAASDHGPMLPGAALVVRYGVCEDTLVVGVPWLRSTGPSHPDAELAALAWEERLAHVDRLRAVAVALPDDVTALVAGALVFGPSIGHRHPLDEAEVLIRAGVAPADAADVFDASVAEPGDGSSAREAVLTAALGARSLAHRPHEDPDPARRIARRMLQMLRGKRKWSGGTGAGFHTEITHLTRGFEQRDRELAGAVLAALLDGGLLVEKVSVGQHHVSLLSRRAADIDALIDDGVMPPGLHLPAR